MTEFIDYSILLEELPDELERDYLQQKLEQNVIGCISTDECFRPLQESISIAIKCLIQTSNSKARVEYRGELYTATQLEALFIHSCKC